MTGLLIGLGLFVGGHLLPALPGSRAALVGRLGEGPFKGLVSLLVAAGLGLIAWSWGAAPVDAVRAPPGWARHVAWVTVPLAFVMLVAAYVPSRIGWWLGHPMILAVAVWGATHTFVNHEARSAVLFGTLGAWGLVGWLLAGLRQGFRPKPWPEAPRDGLVVAIGLGAAAATVALHPWLYGVPAYP